jgi:hypothetical protein
MNPNSTHQLWSRWDTTVTVPFHAAHVQSFFRADMQHAVARWFRAKFGAATEMRLLYDCTPARSVFSIECRTEGAPVSDPAFRKGRMGEIGAFFGEALRKYGRADVRVDVHIEAGDAGDGKPPAQLILGPPVSLLPRGVLLGR